MYPLGKFFLDIFVQFMVILTGTEVFVDRVIFTTGALEYLLNLLLLLSGTPILDGTAESCFFLFPLVFLGKAWQRPQMD